MSRMTGKSDAYYWVEKSAVRPVEEGYSGEAVERLARLENLSEELVRSHAALSAELEELRGQGKTKSVAFRERLGRRLQLQSMLDLLRLHDLM